MKIYKKLFAYVQDKKYLGVLAIIFSAISALLTVYGYYLIYKFLDKLIINSNLSGAESIPKFQVEVSHPKEIHLATCSPSIF
ncbi:ABC transporter ATP-binding protein/permease [Streptococcus pneumoniae]|nr:ABC transporter ATP-binding protein/permease [Streptococcus pneumoniae]